MITGILLSLHYTPHIHYSYYSIMYIIREVYYGWSLRYIHSNGASFLFIVLFIHIGRGLYYGSYYYNSNSWFSGIIIFTIILHFNYLWINSKRLHILQNLVLVLSVQRLMERTHRCYGWNVLYNVRKELICNPIIN